MIYKVSITKPGMEYSNLSLWDAENDKPFVKFMNGQLPVTDPTIIEKLEAVQDEYGLVFESFDDWTKTDWNFSTRYFLGGFSSADKPFISGLPASE